jgi:hypothetical protein
MAAARHSFDDAAEELAGWIDKTALALADGIVQGKRVPFAAPVNEQQKLDYYRGQLFADDGTPNVAGRSRLMDRLGPADYARVFGAVSGARRLPITMDTGGDDDGVLSG